MKSYISLSFLLDFFDSQKFSYRKPDQIRPPRPLARRVPGRLIGLDRVDLISSGNPPLRHHRRCALTVDNCVSCVRNLMTTFILISFFSI